LIELKKDSLVFTFPEVHPGARLTLDFQRTLRIPDDGKDYALPPGLGRFPIRHVDDLASRIPETWVRRGGVLLPMFQSEAMWLNFDCAYVRDQGEYPFAIKIATGKVNAVTGDDWMDKLHRRPQDYLVAPEQPWLDGYCVEKGFIRQFVAMPLGTGYTAEEQITGKAVHGGLQVIVYPMKREVFERRFPKKKVYARMSAIQFSEAMPSAPMEMGLAPGGRMRQEIYEDPFAFNDWDRKHASRCFVHIANSLVWRSVTGEEPPTVPPTAREYTNAGLPWFDYYAESPAIEGGKKLGGLKSIARIGREKGDVPLPENESVTPNLNVNLRKGLKPDQVREGQF